MSTDDTSPILDGAEPFSHHGDGAAGVLVLHGFTGNPSSMRGLAEAFAAAGYHVELPRLAGHGTTIEDMLTTTWADWTGEVEQAYRRLAARASEVAVAGLSMGGSLALWVAMQHPEIKGLFCVNPATAPLGDDIMDMVREAQAGGTAVMPGIGNDIADPDEQEIAYDGTPLSPLLSFVSEGLEPMTKRYGELQMPLRLVTSRQDHVVQPSDSVHLAETYGGEVQHTWLERSYHVATQDYDKEQIFAEAVTFADRVTGR
ncbi:MAG: alpha/beta fold hydrolase [Actinomycetota bacterium]|nr:alpha/beta fold hydrolase [Actinomycetota bacterium]